MKRDDSLKNTHLLQCKICYLVYFSTTVWLISPCVFSSSIQLVTLGIKILMLLQARNLLLSGRLTIGSLVSFFLYQKPMSNNLKVNKITNIHTAKSPLCISVVKYICLLLMTICFCYRRFCTAMEKQCPQLESFPKCSVILTGHQSVRRREIWFLRSCREELFSKMSPSRTPQLRIKQYWR